MYIGKIVRNYRIANNLSMRDFANKCNLSHTYIAAIEKENNKRKSIDPSLSVITKISDALEIPIDILVKQIYDDDITQKDYLCLYGLTQDDKEMIKFQINYLRKKNGDING